MFRFHPRILIVDSSTDENQLRISEWCPGGRAPLIFKPNILFRFVTSGTKESFVTRTNALLFYTLISTSDVIMSNRYESFQKRPTANRNGGSCPALNNTCRPLIGWYLNTDERSFFCACQVTRPSLFLRVPSYFEALWYPHFYFDRKSNI